MSGRHADGKEDAVYRALQEFLDRWGEGLLAAGYASSRFDALAAHLDELGVPLAREDGRLHLPGTSTYGFPMVISPLVERPRIGDLRGVAVGPAGRGDRL